MLQQFNIVVDSLRSFLTQLAGYLPRLIGALVILLVGWIIARWIRVLVAKLLAAVRLDQATKKAGIDDMLRQGGIELTMSGVIAGLVYWLIVLVTLLAAIDSLGLAVASDVLNQVVLFLPNVVVAVLILIFGALFGNLIRGIVATYLAGAQIAGAKVIASIAHYAVLIFAVAVALVQLGIGRELVTSAFQIAFGAVCLALALAFGLGGREWAAKLLDKVFGKQ
ncbi:hypothetical protein HRbin33_00646 [bacterium HR33]|nr:hypothetical protein HRbin33_00646 [bacterium HR33]